MIQDRAQFRRRSLGSAPACQILGHDRVEPGRIADHHQIGGERADEHLPNIVVTHPLGPRDNLALYRLIGAIFDRDAEAERLCGELPARPRRVARGGVSRAPTCST